MPEELEPTGWARQFAVVLGPDELFRVWRIGLDASGVAAVHAVGCLVG